MVKLDLHTCNLALPSDFSMALDEISAMLNVSKSQALEHFIASGQAIDFFYKQFARLASSGTPYVNAAETGPERLIRPKTASGICDRLVRSALKFEITKGRGLQTDCILFKTLRDAWDDAVKRLEHGKPSTYTLTIPTYQSLDKKYKGGGIRFFGFWFAQIGITTWLYQDGRDFRKYLDSTEKVDIMDFLAHKIATHDLDKNETVIKDTRDGLEPPFPESEAISPDTTRVILTVKPSDRQRLNHCNRPPRSGGRRSQK